MLSVVIGLVGQILIYLEKYLLNDKMYMLAINSLVIILSVLLSYNILEPGTYINPLHNIFLVGLTSYILISKRKINKVEIVRLMTFYAMFIDIRFDLKCILFIFYLFVFANNNIILSLVRITLIFQVFVFKELVENYVFLFSLGGLFLLEIFYDYLLVNKEEFIDVFKYVLWGVAFGNVTYSSYFIIIILSLFIVESSITKKNKFLSFITLFPFISIHENNIIYMLPVIIPGVISFPKMKIKKDFLTLNQSRFIILFTSINIFIQLCSDVESLFVKLLILISSIICLKEFLQCGEEVLDNNFNKYISSIILIFFSFWVYL